MAMPEWFKLYWNPLKIKIKYTIVCAIIVLIVMLIIILLSKLNQNANFKVPLGWKSRVKNIIKGAQKDLNDCKMETNVLYAYHSLSNAIAKISAAKQLIGVEALPQVTGINIGKLEEEIDSLYEEMQKHPTIKSLVSKNIDNTNNNVQTPILNLNTTPKNKLSTRKLLSSP